MLATKACLSLLISPSARTWSSRFSKNFNFSFLSLFNQQFASFWHVFCSALGSCCRRQSDKNRLSLKQHTGAGKSLQWQTQTLSMTFHSQHVADTFITYANIHSEYISNTDIRDDNGGDDVDDGCADCCFLFSHAWSSRRFWYYSHALRLSSDCCLTLTLVGNSGETPRSLLYSIRINSSKEKVSCYSPGNKFSFTHPAGVRLC